MSFLEELQKLAQPAPALPDLEDDVDGTVEAIKHSKVVHDDDEPVHLRKRIVGVATANDTKYEGEKVSRSEMFGDHSEMAGLADSAVNDSDAENSDASSMISDEDNDSECEDLDKDENGVQSSLSDDGVEESSDESGDEGEGEESEYDEEESEKGEASAEPKNDNKTSLLSDVDRTKEEQKAESVRSQLTTWDQLLFLKIKLQSAMRAYNQLPRGQLYKDLLKDSDDITKENIKTARKNAKSLVTLLLEAEHILLASSPLTKSIVGEEGGMVDSDDEEIESSEDELENDEEDGQHSYGEEESDGISSDKETNSATPVKSSYNAKQLDKKLIENDKNFSNFRTKTLTKWDERTRLTGPRRSKDAKRDFSAFDKGGVVQQIEKIMADKTRVLKRSQTKRSENDRLGGDSQADEDAEIFDDDDFYQVLLKEMIEKKTNKSSDPVAMTRHYIEMQKLKSKRAKKRIFDNRLSKERKIKYVAIPKLVNFHPARPELIEWTHESRNELFKSLFA